MAIPETPAIRAVLFDFGLVLSGPPEAGAWARMLAVSGLSEQQLDGAYWADRHDYDRGALSGPAYWEAVARHAGTHFDAAQVATLIAADVDLWTDMNVPMVEWAGALQAAGIATGILSNMGDAMAAGVCAKLRWLSGFDHSTWSHSLGIAKPEPAIYIHAAQALGVTPEHILFIDDRGDNIAAARQVGMQALQYSTHAAFEREMRDRKLGWLLDLGDTSSVPVLGRSEPF